MPWKMLLSTFCSESVCPVVPLISWTFSMFSGKRIREECNHLLWRCLAFLPIPRSATQSGHFAEAWTAHDPFASSAYRLVGRCSRVWNSHRQRDLRPEPNKPSTLNWSVNSIFSVQTHGVPHVSILRIVLRGVISARLIPKDVSTSGEAHGVANAVVSNLLVSGAARTL